LVPVSVLPATTHEAPLHVLLDLSRRDQSEQSPDDGAGANLRIASLCASSLRLVSLRLIGLVLALLAVPAAFAQVDVLTAQYDLNRTSSNMQETVLTPANVNSAQFGKLFTRVVDAPFYASPLIVTNFNVPGVGVRDLVFIATLNNTVYAFDADNPNVSAPYWQVNLGAPVSTGCCFLGPTLGILSTPVINRATNTIYVTAIIQSSGVGLYVFALDLSTGALKYNSPQRITYTFPSGVTQTAAIQTDSTPWYQRSALTLYNDVLYVGTANVEQTNGVIKTQEGFIQTFQADNLSNELASFETTPSGQGGAFWQAGRGLAVDSSGNVFAAFDSNYYNPPNSFGDSVVKFTAGTLAPADWFTPADWSFLYAGNLDETADGVTLIPGTTLAFTGGKVGTIYLLNQTDLGGLEGTGTGPVQEFQASQGCGTIDCGQYLATAYWANATNPYLYVWDSKDYLRAYPFSLTSQQFVPGGATIGPFLSTKTGGITVSSNGSTPATGIVWATTATQDPSASAVPGTLRAYNANNITQELYDSDQVPCRDGLGSFVKMATPIVANGKVYVNTQSNVLQVYGLLPTSGVVPVTVGPSIAGPTITVDGGTPCTGSQSFQWPLGSTHILATSSPQAGATGTQFVWQNWSDGQAMTHDVTANAATTSYIGNFNIQYQLTTQISPAAGAQVGTISPPTGFFNAGSSVQVSAAPNPGFTTFTGFSGVLSGTANPSSIVMTGPLSVTANFQYVAGTTSFITALALNQPTERNNYSGWVGMKFTVGATALNVSALGRVCVAGNAASHTVMLVNASGTDVPGASVTVNMVACTSGQFVYAPLASAVTLLPNTSYFLVSQEASGGDQWYDYGGVSSTADAAVNSSIYSSDGVTWIPVSTANTSYVPPNFLYSTTVAVTKPAIVTQPQNQKVVAGATATFSATATGGGLSYQWEVEAPGGSSFTSITGATSASYTTPVTTVLQSGAQYICVVTNTAGSTSSNAATLTVTPAPASTNYVTSFALGTLRNNFSGWVGMRVTVGNSSVTVSGLGRMFAPGDTGSHTVKIVAASNGQDVSGGSVTISMSGGAAGSFVYANLPATVTLNANTTYYVLSQETASGDQWYDMNTTVAGTAVASEVGSVWSPDGVTYNANGTASESYGPVDFQYATALSQPAITAQPQNQTVGAGATVSFSVTATGGGLSYQWEFEAPGGSSFTAITGATSSSYTTPATTLAQSGTQFMCVVTNTAASTPSNPATLTVNSTPPSTNYVTSATLGTLRNNFSGWVGMSITVGGSPLTISGLGRIFASGDTGSHVVKIVTASNSQDVSGGSVTISLSGGTAGSFTYANLPAAVTLNANTAYYILSEETSGGDGWYDHNTTIATTSVAVDTTSVYSYDGATYLPNGPANQPYGPVDFQYATALSQPVITAQPQNQTVGAGATATFTVAATGGGLSYQWESEAPGGSSFTSITGATSSSYTTAATTLTQSGTQYMCVVTNNAASTPSNASTLTVNSSPPATNYITSANLGTLRNNFGGWVGMSITVGSSALTVSGLGRMFAPGDTGSHVVKIVTASNSQDVSGGSVTISMSGGTAGSFTYANLPTAVTLSANTTYYILSEEMYLEDQWYDYNTTVTTTSVATETTSVYSYDGATYILNGPGDQSYGPVSFIYSLP
jgi:hypothetical protein